MRLKIDKAGRIVLPKAVRDRLRLRPGSDLRLEESPDGLLLRQVRRRPSLVEKDGLLVHCGEAVAGLDWSRTLDDLREERIRDLAGL
jgi:AbrB family looped-hinge helix DNA binding protein